MKLLHQLRAVREQAAARKLTDARSAVTFARARQTTAWDELKQCERDLRALRASPPRDGPEGYMASARARLAHRVGQLEAATKQCDGLTAMAAQREREWRELHRAHLRSQQWQRLERQTRLRADATAQEHACEEWCFSHDPAA